MDLFSNMQQRHALADFPEEDVAKIFAQIQKYVASRGSEGLSLFRESTHKESIADFFRETESHILYIASRAFNDLYPLSLRVNFFCECTTLDKGAGEFYWLKPIDSPKRNCKELAVRINLKGEAKVRLSIDSLNGFYPISYVFFMRLASQAPSGEDSDNNFEKHGVEKFAQWSRFKIFSLIIRDEIRKSIDLMVNTKEESIALCIYYGTPEQLISLRRLLDK